MADDEAPKLNIGAAIGEKMSETIKNMDIVSVLQKMVATQPEDEQSEEVRNKLQGVLDQYNAMTAEDREQFTAKLKEALASKISKKLSDPNNLKLAGLEEAIGNAVMQQMYLYLAAFVIFILLLVFFGYKLYKSIKEKEKRKEEKKKQKQMKKKK